MSTNGFGQPIGAAVPDWAPRPRPGDAPLVGRYCRLEKLMAFHACDLYANIQEAADDRDWTYLFWERPRSADEYRALVDTLSASPDQHYAIVDARTAQPVGSAALMRCEPAHGVIEVGHILYTPRLQRSKAGTEAQYLLMKRAFDLGYRRYEWKCDALNGPSRAAAARYGFRFEGVFRQAVVYKGRTRDTAWHSITDGEWPRIRAAFEAWLAEDNFDAEGRQRRALADIRRGLTEVGSGTAIL